MKPLRFLYINKIFILNATVTDIKVNSGLGAHSLFVHSVSTVSREVQISTLALQLWSCLMWEQSGLQEVIHLGQ